MERILINKDNLSFFAGMLSSAAAERILEGKEVGIGAIANTDEGKSIPAGALSFYIDESLVRVTWVYVVPEWRQTGFATELLCTAIEGFIYDDDSEATTLIAIYPATVELDALFASCGFELLEEEQGSFLRTTIGDLVTIPLDNRLNSNRSRIIQLSQLDPRLISALLRDNEMMRDILEPDPTRWVECYLPFSYAYVTNNYIMGLLLFAMRSGDLYLEFAYSQKPETMALPYLIETVRRELTVDYPPETPLYMATTGATAAAIAAKLLRKMQITRLHIAQLDFEQQRAQIESYLD